MWDMHTLSAPGSRVKQRAKMFIVSHYDIAAICVAFFSKGSDIVATGGDQQNIQRARLPP